MLLLPLPLLLLRVMTSVPSSNACGVLVYRTPPARDAALSVAETLASWI
jgi:hypothetical protein